MPARRPTNRPAALTQGTGMFTGNPAPPQDLGRGGLLGLFTGTTMSGPGLRVARSVASGESSVYRGTQAPPPQNFVRQADGTNSQSALTAIPKVNTRRTQGKSRGVYDVRGDVR